MDILHYAKLIFLGFSIMSWKNYFQSTITPRLVYHHLTNCIWIKIKRFHSKKFKYLSRDKKFDKWNNLEWNPSSIILMFIHTIIYGDWFSAFLKILLLESWKQISLMCNQCLWSKVICSASKKKIGCSLRHGYYFYENKTNVNSKLYWNRVHWQIISTCSG